MEQRQISSSGFNKAKIKFGGRDRTKKSTKDSGLDNSCSLFQDLYSEVLHAFAASDMAQNHHTFRRAQKTRSLFSDPVQH